MESSCWADNTVKPPRSSSQHAPPNRDVYQDPSIFAPPRSQPVRIASPDPNPGPSLFNPAVAAQVANEMKDMTQAIPKRGPRPPKTKPLSDRLSPPPDRSDSVVSIQRAPLSNATNTHDRRQSSPAVTANPANVNHKPTTTSTPTTTPSSKMPSRPFPLPHDRKKEHDRPTHRVPSPDGNQWQNQKNNKFDENMLLEHTGTRESLGRFKNKPNEYNELDAPGEADASLSYDDYAEPPAAAAPVSAIATTAGTIPGAHRANLIKETEMMEKQKELKQQREYGEKAIEERKAMEDAVRVAQEQEVAERKAELNRQRYEVEVHNNRASSFSSAAAIFPQPFHPKPKPIIDTGAQLAAATNKMLGLIEEKGRLEAMLKRGQDKVADLDKEIGDMAEQLRLLQRQ